MNYEFYFQDRPHLHSISVWAYQKRPDGVHRIDIKDGRMNYVLIDPCVLEEGAPLIELDRRLFSELAIAMMESLSKQGLKTKNESYMDGKIEAMKDNLNDNRNVVNQLLEIIKGK